jgi:hypothetical protein
VKAKQTDIFGSANFLSGDDVVNQKKGMRWVSVLVLVFLLSVIVSACTPTESATGGQTYYLEELKMNVSLPEDGFVLTRGMDDNDPLLAALGITKEDLEFFENSSIYLTYSGTTGDSMLFLYMYEDLTSQDIFNYNLLSDEQLSAIAENRMAYKNFNYTYTGEETYVHNGTTYLVYEYEYDDDGETVYRKEYVTVHNGQRIEIVLAVKGVPLTATQTSQQEEIINNLEFTETLEKPMAVEYSEVKDFYFDEFKIRVDVPDDGQGYFLTKDLAADDPYLTWEGTTKEAVLNVLDELDACLIYVYPDPYYEIVVSVSDNTGNQSLSNFNGYSDALLTEMSREMVAASQDISSDAEEDYIVYSDYEIYRQGELRYQVLSGWGKGVNGEYNLYQYLTIDNDRLIYIWLHVYHAEVSDALMDKVKYIVDSITFGSSIAPS